ncbi:hypothetical protein V8C34DRAFT_298520 [Trichoderma compactum]
MNKRFRIQRRSHTSPRDSTRTFPSTSGLVEFITAWSSLSSKGPVKYHVKASPQCSICVGRIFNKEITMARKSTELHLRKPRTLCNIHISCQKRRLKGRVRELGVQGHSYSYRPRS